MKSIAYISIHFLALMLSFSNIAYTSNVISKQNSIEKNWMDALVEQEFVRFEKKGITQKMIVETYNECSTGTLLGIRSLEDFKRYKIIDSKVYGENTNVKRMLEAICEEFEVPDVDFIYYNQDVIDPNFYQVNNKLKKAPILVSAKKKGFEKVILFMDWNFRMNQEDHGWNLLIHNINENQLKYPWGDKIDKVVWRGTTTDGHYTWDKLTSYPRGFLVYTSQNKPEIIDAGFVKYNPLQVDNIQLFKDNLGLKSFVSQVEHMQYKYQLDLDGVTASYPGVLWKLLTGCLVMKQNSDDVMWFYDALVPWKHYVPVLNDLRDLESKIKWAQEHDEEARTIAENGREFALTHFMPEHIMQYFYKILVKYASLQKFKPKLTRQEKQSYATNE